MGANLQVRVTQDEFDIGAEIARLSEGHKDAGAVVSFTGLVRDLTYAPPSLPVTALVLEHYPGMTEKEIALILEQAAQRWPIAAALVVHRVGRLLPGDQIVLVVAISSHRQAAFESCAFIMDYLKIRATFWKREETSQGNHWVGARTSDNAAAQRW